MSSGVMSLEWTTPLFSETILQVLELTKVFAEDHFRDIPVGFGFGCPCVYSIRQRVFALGSLKEQKQLQKSDSCSFSVELIGNS